MHVDAQASKRLKSHTEPLTIALSPKAASEASSLSLRTIMNAIRSGELRSCKRGRRRLIFPVDLRRYLRADR